MHCAGSDAIQRRCRRPCRSGTPQCYGDRETRLWRHAIAKGEVMRPESPLVGVLLVTLVIPGVLAPRSSIAQEASPAGCGSPIWPKPSTCGPRSTAAAWRICTLPARSRIPPTTSRWSPARRSTSSRGSAATGRSVRPRHRGSGGKRPNRHSGGASGYRNHSLSTIRDPGTEREAGREIVIENGAIEVHL